MTKMNDNSIAFGKTAEEIILEHCSEFTYPICFNAPFGHIDNNLAIKLGKTTKLTINKEFVTIV